MPISRALSELIHVSRAVGADPDLVQGGGGNTSVKTGDGQRMLVKTSGTFLSEMSRRRGWAELHLPSLKEILETGDLNSLPPRRREKEVLRLLGNTVIRPGGARPSVESSLHALLGRVVIHTHPVGLNVLLCSRQSKIHCLALLGKSHARPLYIPYVDPGHVLASRVNREIHRYSRNYGRLPAVVFLENHGLFVAAAEVRECLSLQRDVIAAGRRFIGCRRVNPLQFPGPFPGVIRRRRRRTRENALESDVRNVLLRGCGTAGLVLGDRSALARKLVGDPEAVRLAGRGAFTPDQIVYCRTHPLVLPPHNGAGAGEGWRRTALGRVTAYRQRFRLDPRVVLVPGSGIFYRAPDRGQLRVVAEVYRSAVATILYSKQAGGPRFLTRRQSSFIEGWEVEAFRARVAASGGRKRK